MAVTLQRFSLAAAVFLLLALLNVAGSFVDGYSIQKTYEGESFFEAFNFYTDDDTNNGFTDYVDEATARGSRLISYDSSTGTNILGVDSSGTVDSDPAISRGRRSVRLESKEAFDHGLFVLDIVHMPVAKCGVWPAFWTVIEDHSQWPTGGEIDIVEYANTESVNIPTLHTDAGCTLDASTHQSGTIATDDCNLDGAAAGCQVTTTAPVGAAFNNLGGGVYAMQWTAEHIKVWAFPRDSIPASLAAEKPNLGGFGRPVASFKPSCDVDGAFYQHHVVLNIALCGNKPVSSWAADGCPSDGGGAAGETCIFHVANRPEEFVDAYWEVNSLKVFKSDLED